MNAPAPHVSTAPAGPWLSVHPTLGISLMDHLYNRLEGAYPGRWRAQFPSAQAIANWRESWAEAFQEEGLTPDDVKVGLRACRKRHDWPPSVAEFVKACRPGPNVDAALYEAAQQLRLRAEGKDEWSNPAIYWAALKVGEFDMLNLSHAALLKRFGAALDTVLAQDQIPNVPPSDRRSLPGPGQGRASPERVEAAMQEVRATKKEPGNKRWAERIVARDKAGEKIALGVLRMAQVALGLRSGF